MKTATIAELHEHLDEYLDLVRAGEAVEIRDDGAEVARILPTPKRIAVNDLIAAGRLRAPRTADPLPESFFQRERPEFPTGVLQALLDEREEGW
jgi:antitoxin (DNA-binding transcriptional repressor) of toxin-antitoxin stability system